MTTQSKIAVPFVMLGALFASTYGRGDEETAPASVGSPDEEMTLVAGEQRILDATQIASFSESTRGIIQVKVPRDGRKMIITASRPGATSLLLIDHKGKEKTIAITVFAMLPKTVVQELEKLFGNMDTIRLRQVGARVFIDGTVSTETSLRRVEQAAKIYKGQVASLVELDPTAVRPRTNIRLDLMFIEMRNRDSDKLGIHWPGQYGATAVLQGSLDLTTGGLTAAYEVVDQALPSLEAAARYGWIKIRKRATVITTSGHQASYEAGGEVNVAIAGSQSAELRSIPYGARLVVTPRLSEDEQILDLEVEAVVSDLTETTQDVPGRSVSRVQTLVHLGLGQSIMLSGLEAESESTTKEGLPYLSKIPILGLLFGTRSHVEEQVEGIIVITPTVLDNLDRDGKRRLEEALVRFEEFDGKFEAREEK